MNVTQVHDTYTKLGRLGREPGPLSADLAEKARSEKQDNRQSRPLAVDEGALATQAINSDLSITEAQDLSASIGQWLKDDASQPQWTELHNLSGVRLLQPIYV